MNYQENPFNILGASITDNRRKIVALCEEKVLYLDSSEVESARNILTTPQKRLSAEMHWFPDCDEEDIATIREYIAASAENPNTELTISAGDLSLFNAYLAALPGKKTNAYSEIKSELLRLSRLYEALDAEEIKAQLNECRTKSGFPLLERESDIETVLAEMRNETRQILSKWLSRFSEASYVKIVTQISEAYSSGRNRGQAVLEDIISEYSLKIAGTFQKKTEDITRFAGYINAGANKIDLKAAVNDLLAALFDWDTYAQPMQLEALFQGDDHEASRKMFSEIRRLSVNLHNNFNETKYSLMIVQAMQEIFAELPEAMEMLKEDEEQLRELMQSGRLDEIIGTRINDLVAMSDEIKNSDSVNPASLEKIKAQITSLNRDIIAEYGISGQAEIRELLCNIGRTVSLTLHNDKGESEKSLEFVTFLLQEFSDMSEMQKQLEEDAATLRKLISEKKAAEKLSLKFQKLQFKVAAMNDVPELSRTNTAREVKQLTTDIAAFIRTNLTGDQRIQALKNVCYMVRSGAIDLHNKHQDTELAKTMIEFLLQEFNKIDELNKKLNEDLKLLDEQIWKKRAMEEARKKKQQEEEKKKQNRTVLLWVLILAGALIWFVSANTSSSGSSGSSGSSKSNYTYSTPKPTVKPATSTVKPTTYSTPKPTEKQKLQSKKYTTINDLPSSADSEDQKQLVKDWLAYPGYDETFYAVDQTYTIKVGERTKLELFRAAYYQEATYSWTWYGDGDVTLEWAGNGIGWSGHRHCGYFTATKPCTIFISAKDANGITAHMVIYAKY